jgi:hypothetical protein
LQAIGLVREAGDGSFMLLPPSCRDAGTLPAFPRQRPEIRLSHVADLERSRLHRERGRSTPLPSASSNARERWPAFVAIGAAMGVALIAYCAGNDPFDARDHRHTKLAKRPLKPADIAGFYRAEAMIAPLRAA